MKWLHTSYLFALGFVLSATGNAFAQQIQFTQIDYQFPDGTKADSTRLGVSIRAATSSGFTSRPA